MYICSNNLYMNKLHAALLSVHHKYMFPFCGNPLCVQQYLELAVVDLMCFSNLCTAC